MEKQKKGEGEAVKRKTPVTAEDFLERGEAYERDGDYDKAIEDFGEAIRLKPGYAEAYYNRGDVYHIKGCADWRNFDVDNLNRAIADFDQAIRLKPDYAEAYHYRGCMCLISVIRDLDKAIENFDNAIRLKSDHIMAYSERSRAHRIKGNYDKAIEDCDQAILQVASYIESSAFMQRLQQRRPNLAEMYKAKLLHDRGKAYAAKGDFDRAFEDFDNAIRLRPDNALVNAGVYNSRALAYCKKGDLDKAIADCDEAIRLDPDFAYAYDSRGEAYEKKGDLDKAIADYEEALRIDPNHAEAKQHLEEARKRQRGG